MSCILYWLRNLGEIFAAHWISQHIDDDDLDGQQKHELPFAAKALSTPVGVGLAIIANSYEKVTPRHRK